jgi:flagellar basal-body rod protein FlgC
MAFLAHLNTPVSGMTAQRLRMDVIAQNIANAVTTETEAGGPYRRQITLFNERSGFANIRHRRPSIHHESFGEILNMTLAERRELKKNRGVEVTAVLKDELSPLTPVYDPSHPHADEDGYYYLPNVDVAEEQLDLMAATHSYNNNMAVYDTLVSMTQRTLSMGRG